jgi:solute carrier family 66 (lysosomal lysine-arginine transporter), member 1
VSFILAWIGVAGSLFSLFPQIYTNYRNGSVEGLSLGLVLFWTFGDVTNLTGTILTHQLPTQTWAAIFYMMIDVALLFQFFYYKQILPVLGYEPIPDHIEEVVVNDHLEDETSVISNISNGAVAIGKVALISSLPGVSGRIVSFLEERACDFRPMVQEPFKTFGVFAAWSSGLLYLCSRYVCINRIPQVIKNYKRKSVRGLSFYMFGLAIVGNVGYGFSVLLRLQNDPEFYFTTFPYLVGSLGVLGFDLFNLFQASIYGGFE